MVKAENGNDRIKENGHDKEALCAESARAIVALLQQEGGKQLLRSDAKSIAPPVAANEFEGQLFAFLQDESKCSQFELMLCLLIMEVTLKNNNLGNKIRDWLFKKYSGGVVCEDEGGDYVLGLLLGLQLVDE